MDRAPVSVIIPTYEREQFLERAIRSVLIQTLPCSEIIIVDGGSTEHTDEQVRDLQNSHPEICYLFQKNRGAAAARNFGILRAVQPLIAFLDSDDHWQPEKIARQYRAMTAKPEYLISHTGERWLRRGMHLNQKQRHLPRGGDIFDHCLKLCAVGMSTVMARRELFSLCGLFDPAFRCCEDYDYWLRVSCRHPFLLVQEALTVKEGGRGDQLSQQYRVGMDKLRVAAIAKLLEHESLTASQRYQAIHEIIRKSTIYGNGCSRHGRYEEACHYLDLAKSYRAKL